MSHLIFVGGQKGGTTKTTTAHLLCLGAVLKRQPAVYVLTDPMRSLREAGRPYGVIDGREASDLEKIIRGQGAMKNGWVVIDGGGNRPAFDQTVAAEADYTVLPFRASEEDLETVAKDLAAMPGSVGLPSAWPTNRLAQESAARLIDGLEQAFPGRVLRPVPFVNSVSDLLRAELGDPSGPVRNAARHVFEIIGEAFERRAVNANQ